jgi:ankyrin repeat protein
MKPVKQLAEAAAQGDLEVMHTLLGASPALAADWQPLMDACFNGQVRAVELLLDHGADPNVVSKSAFKYRPLHRTIERKVTMPRTEDHVRVVDVLLERGADPLAPGSYAQVSAVAMAAFAGDARFLPPLLQHVPELDLFSAAAVADLERGRALVAEDPKRALDVDDRGRSALHYCCQSRLGTDDPDTAASLLTIAELLIAAGAPLNGCLDAAVYGNGADLTRLLLDRGAAIEDGDTLNHAACDGAQAALEILFERGVDLNDTRGTEHHGGYTPFGCTLTMRSVTGAQWFLDHGVDPNYVGGARGESSLHVAVRNGAGPKLLQLLVERGADPNAKDEAGMTPLAAARAKGQKSGIQYFTGIRAAE